MKTSEAYQMLILSKGLADTTPYDEFAVWWASKGISKFYKEREEFKRRVAINFKNNTGLPLEGLGRYFIDSMQEFLQPTFKSVRDAMLRREHKMNIRRSTRDLIPGWIKDNITNQVRDALLRNRFANNRGSPGFGGPFATPPGGNIVGIIIGIFIGGVTALNNARRLRNERNNRNTDPLTSPREYISQRYNFIPTWENPYDPQLAWRVLDVYIFYQTYLETGEWTHEILTPEQVEDYLQNNIIYLFGGSGGAGGGGGSWL